MLRLFEPYGEILSVKILHHKQCAFVNYVSVTAAVEARMIMQNYELGTSRLKINFGKETYTRRKRGRRGSGMGSFSGGVAPTSEGRVDTSSSSSPAIVSGGIAAAPQGAANYAHSAGNGVDATLDQRVAREPPQPLDPTSASLSAAVCSVCLGSAETKLVACGHTYCSGCFQQLSEHAVRRNLPEIRCMACASAERRQKDRDDQHHQAAASLDPSASDAVAPAPPLRRLLSDEYPLPQAAAGTPSPAPVPHPVATSSDSVWSKGLPRTAEAPVSDDGGEGPSVDAQAVVDSLEGEAVATVLQVFPPTPPTLKLTLDTIRDVIAILENTEKVRWRFAGWIL